ncbi:MAG: FAD:protein FMN transferase [Acidobacteriota bacterium]
MKLAGLLAIAALLTAPGAGARVTRAQYLMGTICEISADSPEEIDGAFAEARRVEAMLSTWRDDSELTAVNRGAIPGTELAALLRTALWWSDATQHAFDPRVRPLIDIWKTRADGALPTDEQLAQAMVLVRGGQQLEEGAFGKGYALDRMLSTIHGQTVINFGGQIVVRGAHQVTVADPSHRDHAVIAFSLSSGSLSTSSGSEKTFDVGGRRFSHILDPRTGVALPPRGSVSVVHPSALVADILSTALYVMDWEEGLAWARAHEVTAIFIDEHNTVRASVPLPGLTMLDRRFTIGE